MKSSSHSLIPFWPLFCSFQAHIPAGWRLETRLFTSRLLKRPSLSLYNLWHGPRRKQPPYCWGGLFTHPLCNNRLPILVRVRMRGKVFTESLPSNGSIRHNVTHKCRVSKYCDIWAVSRQRVDKHCLQVGIATNKRKFIARQRVCKHISATHWHATIGRLLLGNRAVNKLYEQ
jgi:hypothetical protein